MKDSSRLRTVWIIPLLYVSVALAAGLSFSIFEARILPGFVSPMSVSAAMAMYSAVASGMMALTGIVFALVFVMIQFSATAYSPRLVLWVARDPVMWHALGLFSGTFLYAIAAIANLDRSGSGVVPRMSVLIVVVLLVASVALFVVLINRIGRLTVNRMLAYTGDQGRNVIEAMYPVPDTISPDTKTSAELQESVPDQTLIHRGGPMSVQAVHVAGLVQLAEVHGVVIQIVAAVGDTVVESTPLLHVYGARTIDESELKAGILLGAERTFEQDPKYAIRLIVDIAIKALSPAINDPTTAVQALDQVEDLLIRLGRRRLDAGSFRSRDGKLRLILPLPEWEDFLMLAFDEIRYYGAESIQVMRRMKALISEMISVLPDHRRPALQHWQARLQSTIARSFHDEQEKSDASVEDRQGLGIPRRTPAGK